MRKNTSFATRSQKSLATRYAISLLGIALALVLGRALAPLLGGSLPYVLILPAIAFSAWYCGLGPSITSSAIALAALKYSLITPGHAVAISTVRQALDLAALGAAVASIVLLGERRRRECEVLRRDQGDLEQRVRERTIELDAANQGLRELTSRLMQSQDEERRRIARDLHDSVGQNLAAMTMNLTTMLTEIERLTQIKNAASDSLELAQEMSKEVRTVPYLLHPPLLDEAGLASALRWYVQGFCERATIQVDLEVPEDFGRLPQELETAVFRTVQECLTNIHRHSGSATARLSQKDCDTLNDQDHRESFERRAWRGVQIPTFLVWHTPLFFDLAKPCNRSVRFSFESCSPSLRCSEKQLTATEPRKAAMLSDTRCFPFVRAHQFRFRQNVFLHGRTDLFVRGSGLELEFRV